MVVLRTQGLTQPAIANATGTSLSTVNRTHMASPLLDGFPREARKGKPERGEADDRGGLVALQPKPKGGRIRANMTMAEEKALIARFAKAAGAGEMLNIHDLKAADEKTIGHSTGATTIYSLLERHGWRKLMPRPHPATGFGGAIRF